MIHFQTTMGATLSQDMDKFYDVFHTDGALNVMSYSNPKVDQALDLSRSTDDQAKIDQAYKALNGELSKDGPLRNWRYQTGHLFVKKSVQGISLTGTSSGASAYWQYAWIDS